MFTAVIAVNHGGDRVHAQRVDTKTLNPIERIAHQIVADFAATVVINQGIPVLMVTFTRIAVFIERGSVKLGQAKVIGREMTGHPVQNHVQPGSVCRFDKVDKVVAGAKAARRGIETRRLIAPASVKRVLINRQQLQMGEPHPFCIRHQLVRQLAVAQPEIIVRVATP